MANEDVREAVRKAGLHLWQVADELHIQDTRLSKLLRKELPDEKKEEIHKIVHALKKEACFRFQKNKMEEI